jgi:hypothetical protein
MRQAERHNAQRVESSLLYFDRPASPVFFPARFCTGPQQVLERIQLRSKNGHKVASGRGIKQCLPARRVCKLRIPNSRDLDESEQSARDDVSVSSSLRPLLSNVKPSPMRPGQSSRGTRISRGRTKSP